MWVSSGVGTKILICTRARTISFLKSRRFSKSVKSTMSYKRGTENVVPKTRYFYEKTRVSRGGNVVFEWVGDKNICLYKSPDHKLSKKPLFFQNLLNLRCVTRGELKMPPLKQEFSMKN